ncbi:unnamed protein product [Eruca vesicaria subsp. sativa]|uniref:C2 NT-type domain-containing protein n=1 Tax=Eruca vesicaria subsp. sativa TaxID=29727 RepID=A0ABC8M4U9_ERUVS|nr:unnamed protein product [Eruca vesicaria subsp. sativa]
MVLGLRTKSRRDNGVFVEYLISIKELKPWPTSQVPAQCVLLKWENGENNSGSVIAVVGKDTIMFNESLRLTLTLEPKGVDEKKFHKNLLELHVYDAKKKDKGVKNKLLGSAVVNLAEHGVLTKSVPVGAPFTFKKSSRNDANSEIYLTIEPAGEDEGYRSSSSSQPKMRGSVDREGSEFSLASFTDDDDDASSHCSSSRRVSFSAICDANPMNAEAEINKDEKKGWKHVTLKHSNNEAALVSEIENLLREEEKKRHSTELVAAVVSTESDQKDKNDTIASKLKKQFSEIRSLPSPLPPDAARKQMRLRTNTLALGRKTLGMEGLPRLKQLKSIQVHFDGTTNMINDDSKKKESGVSNKLGLITPHESRAETLEDELKEAAALEAAVYSVVAEHSSSMSKVHAPARRLARFYIHACKLGNGSDHSKRARAARAAVSGLILVSKACGNDIPRLTFWLSNSIVLRATLSRGIEKLNLVFIKPGSDEWEDPRAFLAALEKLESWIFSRVVKSVWWQSLTPYMQSAAVKGSMSRKVSGKRRLGHKNQGLYAIELWKSAFKAACERLCPLRGSRQECGCLPMLAKLVMEQLISRLDVAMFNAILRESASEMPTDPVSDPISDINVLPIPAGKASFGAGAELKNAIGTWSRWLEDQFEQKKDKSDSNNKEKPECENFRLFHLLNSLGDLMMLPFKMLADRSTRREVCPTLGPPIIKRVLRNFVPDEFNPHRTPRWLFDDLNSEGLIEENNGCITVFPCAASPTIYLMPSTDSIKRFIEELNNPSLSETGSSVYKKQYTSDDELDDLDTSINSIISAPGTTSSSEWMPKGYGRPNTIRYQLLREIWKEDGLQ